MVSGLTGFGLCVLVDQPRWGVNPSLDTLIGETAERLYVRDLYAPGDAQPVAAITIARGRSATVIARKIQRRLLPSVRESIVRLNARREERSALFARQQHAVDAILRLCPWSYRAEPRNLGASQLFLDPTLSLDLRIDDSDRITITRWSSLDLETVLRLIAAALPEASA